MRGGSFESICCIGCVAWWSEGGKHFCCLCSYWDYGSLGASEVLNGMSNG